MGFFLSKNKLCIVFLITLLITPVLAAAPVADFYGTPTSGMRPLTVSFTDNSTNTPTFWTWNFGDGYYSNAQNPSHAYNSVGTYSVSLTCSNIDGEDSETKTDYIEVGYTPIADFTGSPTSGLPPLTVQFNDTSYYTPTSWNWTFGDGSYSEEQNPSHQYTNVGAYTVILHCNNTYGEDSETKTGYINVGYTPVADFYAYPTSGLSPLVVQFYDNSTNSPTSWSWVFGDGGSSSSQYPSHVYSTAGNMTVNLTVSNEYGSDTLSQTGYIYVYPDQTIEFDKTQYLSTETANVTTIVYEMDEDYDYYAQLLDVSSDVKKEWDVTSELQYEPITVSSYTPGTYTVKLYKEHTITEAVTEIDDDSATFSYTVGFYGNVYNAESGLTISGASVGMFQDMAWVYETTAGDGSYSKTGFTEDSPVQFQVTNAGYTHTSFIFTPPEKYNYNMNLYMIPTNPTHADTAIVGIVEETTSYQAISGATVHVVGNGGAYTTTTTSSASGYYLLDNLPAAGDYDVWSTSGDGTSANYTVTVSESGVTSQIVQIGEEYSLTLTYVDASTGLTIDRTISANLIKDGSVVATSETSSGSLAFTGLEYGTYIVETTSVAYEDDTRTIVVSGNIEQEISLTSSADAGSGSGIQYPPHQVRWVIKDYLGRPLEGVSVNATVIESTSPLSWLFSWIGISTDVAVEDTDMGGTTGTDGSIVFMMVESLKYRLTIQDDTRGIDTQIEEYPKEEEYTVTVWAEETVIPMGDILEYGFYVGDSEDIGNTTMGVYYNDTAHLTSTFCFYVRNETDYLIYSKLYSSQYLINTSYDVETGNDVYIIGFFANHDTYGNITLDSIARIDSGRPLYGDFAVWIPMYVYHYISTGLLLFLASTLVSRRTAKFAVVIFPAFIVALVWNNYLMLDWNIALTLLVLGVLISFKLTEDEGGL